MNVTSLSEIIFLYLVFLIILSIFVEDYLSPSPIKISKISLINPIKLENTFANTIINNDDNLTLKSHKQIVPIQYIEKYGTLKSISRNPYHDKLNTNTLNTINSLESFRTNKKHFDRQPAKNRQIPLAIENNDDLTYSNIKGKLDGIIKYIIKHTETSTNYDIIKRKDIAHSFELEGIGIDLDTCPITEYAKNPLEGSQSFYTTLELLYRLQHFIDIESTKNSNSSRIVKEYHFKKLYNSITNDNNVLLDNILKLHDMWSLKKQWNFKNQSVIIISSGFSGHAVTFMIRDDFIYYINKGKHQKKNFVTVHKYYKTLSQNIINRLYNLSRLSENDYEAARDKILDDINAQIQTSLTNTLVKGYQGKLKQLVGNCAWENLETLVYVYMADQIIQTNSDPNVIQNFITNVYRDFNYFETYIRLMQLKEYVSFYYGNDKCHEDSRIPKDIQCTFTSRAMPVDEKLIERALQMAYTTQQKNPIPEYEGLIHEIYEMLPRKLKDSVYQSKVGMNNVTYGDPISHTLTPSHWRIDHIFYYPIEGITLDEQIKIWNNDLNMWVKGFIKHLEGLPQDQKYILNKALLVQTAAQKWLAILESGKGIITQYDISKFESDQTELKKLGIKPK
jgi:hypothetical protein